MPRERRDAHIRRNEGGVMHRVLFIDNLSFYSLSPCLCISLFPIILFLIRYFILHISFFFQPPNTLTYPHLFIQQSLKYTIIFNSTSALFSPHEPVLPTSNPQLFSSPIIHLSLSLSLSLLLLLSRISTLNEIIFIHIHTLSSRRR